MEISLFDRLVLLFLFLIFIAHDNLVVNGYFINLEPSVRQCFFEDLVSGGQLGINYEVDPENNDRKKIDFEIFGPNEQSLFSTKGEPFGTFQFHAVLDGRHYYCFNSPVAAKVQFNLVGIPATDSGTSDEKDKDPLVKEMETLSIGLRAIKDEQEYMLLREQIHHRTANSTNSRILGWSLLQYIFLGGVCSWQVYYLKRFFEVKRRI